MSCESLMGTNFERGLMCVGLGGASAGSSWQLTTPYGDPMPLQKVAGSFRRVQKARRGNQTQREQRDETFPNPPTPPNTRPPHSPASLAQSPGEPILEIAHPNPPSTATPPTELPAPKTRDTGATMVQISEVKGNRRDNRTAAPTHNKGLGLKLDGSAESQAAGFVGQSGAREVQPSPSHTLHGQAHGTPRY